MREYRFSSPRKEGRYRLIFATVAMLVVVLIDIVTGGSLRALVRTGGASVWSASARTRDAIFGNGYFSSRAALSREIQTLRQTLASYQEGAAAYRVVKEENDALRTLLTLAQKEEGVTAPIVSSVISSPFGTFLIGAGETDGVAKGDLVITSGGFVIGVVEETYVRTSIVRELLAGGSNVEVLLSGAPIGMLGRGGGNAIATLPQEIRVEEGMPVTSPAYGGRAVGIVGRVEHDASSAEQDVYVQLPVNMASLTYVYVVPH